MKKLAFIFLFLFCTPPEVIIDRHSFYAGTVKEGLDIAKMYEWKITKVDTVREGWSTVFLFHYRELDLR